MKILALIFLSLLSSLSLNAFERADFDSLLGRDGLGNCFNTALVASGGWAEVRYTYDEELVFWLESPLCEKVKWNKRKSGDVVLISKDKKPIHAFNYESDYSSLNKWGGRHYELSSLEDIFSTYKGKKTVFRCRTWNSFIEDLDLSEEFQKLIKKLEEIENKFSSLNSAHQSKSTVMEIAFHLQSLKLPKFNNNDERFILSALKTKIKALKKASLSAFSSAIEDLDYDKEETHQRIDQFLKISND